MLNLSVEQINQTSGYPVTALDGMTFTIVTDSGVIYDLGFYESTEFLQEGAYYFFIDNREHHHSAHDPKVVQTVLAVIEEFFRQDIAVMLYICEYVDKRQAARDRLYRSWLTQYVDNDKYTLYSEKLTANSNEYFAGLLILNSNPLKDIIIQAFHSYAENYIQYLKLTGK